MVGACLLTNPENDTSKKIAARSALLDFYSNRAVSFGGFFLASLFGLLTMSTLVQGIKFGEAKITTLFVLLSLIPFLIFALIGYYSLRQFRYYANIANKIEGGAGGTETLRYYAELGELIEAEDTKQKKEHLVRIMKWITDSTHPRHFKLAYSILILFLVVVTYIPRFL